MPWVLIGGIIGARLWHVFTPGYFDGITTQEYFKNPPLLILQIWKGGLGIPPGGVIGGALALFIYTKVKKKTFGMGGLYRAWIVGSARYRSLG